VWTSGGKEEKKGWITIGINNNYYPSQTYKEYSS
jgi:hypothetical protein